MQLLSRLRSAFRRLKRPRSSPSRSRSSRPRRLGTSTKVATINTQNYVAPAGTPNLDYVIEVDASVSNPTSGFTFGGLAFDIVLTGPATRPAVVAYNYRANNPSWVDDVGSNQNSFGNAKDAGASSTDLLGRSSRRLTTVLPLKTKASASMAAIPTTPG